jgi:hypothetical protein
MTFHLLAEAAAPIDFTTLSGWWELARSVGPGATLAMGVGIYWMSAELKRRSDTIKEKDTDLKAEVSYSKDLTTKQLTVISELTTVIKGIDKRDIDSVTLVDTNTNKILTAIGALEKTIITHALGNHDKRQAA